MMAPDKRTKAVSKSRKSSRPQITSKPALSKETISDSESDPSSSESSESQPTNQATAKVTSTDEGNVAKRKKIDVPREARLPKMNGQAKVSETESTSGSASDAPDNERTTAATIDRRQIKVSDAESSSDESEDSSDPMSLDTPQMQERSAESIAGKGKSAAVTSNVVSNWKPPEGFSRTELLSKASSALKRKLLAPSALKGKELWHISIPEGLESSLSTLSTISPSSTFRGAPILKSADGVEYTFRETRKRDVEGVRVLVPDSDVSTYKQVTEARISRTLDLRQILQGVSGDDSHSEAEATVLDVRLLVAQKTYDKEAPPAQPAGLRMMNVPIGVVVKDSPIPFRTPKTTTINKDQDGHVNSVNDTEVTKSKQHEMPEERAQRRAEKARRKAEKEKKKLAKSTDT